MKKMGWHLGSAALLSLLGAKDSGSEGSRIILLSIIAALFLPRLAGIEHRYREETNAGVVQMRNVAKWVTDSWKGPEADIIERHLR